MFEQQDLVFIKLGGSLITDKQVPGSFHQERTRQLAHIIHDTLISKPELRVVIGHGSGSFGHVAANQHDTINGVHTPEQWRGFAEVATAAAALNYQVARELHEAGIAVWRIQPSASARCHDGQLMEMSLHPIQTALEKGLIPLVYGDVALDSMRGGTIISTEMILSYLTHHLPVSRLLLLGEVPGVLDADGTVIQTITPTTIGQFRGALKGSSGTDVTGGMLGKVDDMVRLVAMFPRLEIIILDGREPELLRQVILQQAQAGTRIHFA